MANEELAELCRRILALLHEGKFTRNDLLFILSFFELIVTMTKSLLEKE